MRFLLVFLIGLCLLIGFRPTASAQLNRPPSILIGGSVGTGGLYDFFKFSFDVHYRRGGNLQRFYGLNGVFTSLRVAPGLHYISFGITQRIANWRPKVRHRERPIILSLYYHRDYFLNTINNPDRHRQMVMLMLGVRANLDRLQRVFFEASLGAMYVHEADVKDRYFPMVEFRLSGVVQRHKKTFAKPTKKK